MYIGSEQRRCWFAYPGINRLSHDLAQILDWILKDIFSKNSTVRLCLYAQALSYYVELQVKTLLTKETDLPLFS